VPLHLGNTFECQAESTKTRAKGESVVGVNFQLVSHVLECLVVLREEIWITQIRIPLEYVLISIPQEPQHLNVVFS